MTGRRWRTAATRASGRHRRRRSLSSGSALAHLEDSDPTPEQDRARLQKYSGASLLCSGTRDQRPCVLAATRLLALPRPRSGRRLGALRLQRSSSPRPGASHPPLCGTQDRFLRQCSGAGACSRLSRSKLHPPRDLRRARVRRPQQRHDCRSNPCHQPLRTPHRTPWTSTGSLSEPATRS
jgi:hypothetical protein